MLRLLKILLTGDSHLHKWTQINLIPTYAENCKHAISYDYVCKCEHCGKIKSFKV